MPFRLFCCLTTIIFLYGRIWVKKVINSFWMEKGPLSPWKHSFPAPGIIDPCMGRNGSIKVNNYRFRSNKHNSYAQKYIPELENLMIAYIDIDLLQCSFSRWKWRYCINAFRLPWWHWAWSICCNWSKTTWQQRIYRCCSLSSAISPLFYGRINCIIKGCGMMAVVIFYMPPVYPSVKRAVKQPALSPLTLWMRTIRKSSNWSILWIT